MLVGRLSRLVGISLAAAVLIIGCQNESKSRKKPGNAKGTVTKTDLANNKVSMKVKKERDGSEIEITGSLTPESEVFINGLKRTPADVEINDEIRVEYERSGDGVEMQFTVLRVDVQRPEGWKSTKAAEPELKILPPQPEAPTKADRTFIVPPKPEAAPATTTPPSPGANSAANAQNAEVMTTQIYTEIRHKMDESVGKRAALLKSGKPANDPEVVREEGIIRRARALLMDRGENVEPLVPPLPEDSASPAGGAPASKPAAAGS